jgi:hypothetical protein
MDERPLTDADVVRLATSLQRVPDEIVTSEELAEMLKVSVSTVKRWRSGGDAVASVGSAPGPV